jgi:hypothetical protein
VKSVICITNKDSENGRRCKFVFKEFVHMTLPVFLFRRWSDPASGTAACDASMHGREWYEVQ